MSGCHRRICSMMLLCATEIPASIGGYTNRFWACFENPDLPIGLLLPTITGIPFFPKLRMIPKAALVSPSKTMHLGQDILISCCTKLRLPIAEKFCHMQWKWTFRPCHKKWIGWPYLTIWCIEIKYNNLMLLLRLTEYAFLLLNRIRPYHRFSIDPGIPRTGISIISKQEGIEHDQKG